MLNAEAIHRALRRAGVRTFDSPEVVEAELKRIANCLRDETIARWVGSDLNRALAWQDFRITGGDDPISQLEVRAEAASRRTQRTLQSEELEKLFDEKRARLTGWDRDLWRQYVPGKRLLRLFVGCLGAGLAYEQLRSLILAEMREEKENDNLWPEEFRELTRKVLDDLD